jgi:hypothetical protein
MGISEIAITDIKQGTKMVPDRERERESWDQMVALVGGPTLTYWTRSRRERVRNTRLNSTTAFTLSLSPLPSTLLPTLHRPRLVKGGVPSHLHQARSTRPPAARFVLPSPRHNLLVRAHILHSQPVHFLSSLIKIAILYFSPYQCLR